MVGDPAYDELIAKLDSLRTVERKNALRKAFRKMGVLVSDAIKAKAPTVKGQKRGNAAKYNVDLKDPKIQIRIQTDENASLYSDRVAIAYVGESEHIARLVEYGHLNKRGAKHSAEQVTFEGATAPHPFIRPAFDATKDEAIALFEETMVEEIAKVMNG